MNPVPRFYKTTNWSIKIHQKKGNSHTYLKAMLSKKLSETEISPDVM